MNPISPRLSPISLALLGTVLLLGASFSTSSIASAQVIGYPDPAYGQPVPQPETYGNLTGRNAFYGRLSLGLGGVFFRLQPSDVDTDSFSLTSGVALHVDFSVGLRFAFRHALTLDFDLDRGFAPRLDGDSYDDAQMYAGALGIGYTSFLAGTGLYLGGGVGLGIAWIEGKDAFGDSFTTPTGLGLAAHGRVGYDWTLNARAHLGAQLTVRFLGLTDEEDNAWRGASISASGSVAWY